MENFSCLSLSLFIDGNADATIYEIAAVSLRKIKLMTCVCDRLLLQKQAVKINVQQQKKKNVASIKTILGISKAICIS